VSEIEQFREKSDGVLRCVAVCCVVLWFVVVCCGVLKESGRDMTRERERQ